MDFTNTINEIRNKVDIVDVISSYLPLTQKGKNYFGVCPFHDDTNPSMSVSRDKQIYKCFSCGASGNVFNFIMDYEHVSFKEALVILSKKTGIEINGINLKQETNKNVKEYEMYELALKYYINNMNSKFSKEAKEYLHNRSIDDEMIKEYKIGLSLNNHDDLTKFLTSKGNSLTLLNDIGLSNNNHDVYENRIIFPLYDLNGRVVGFSGRRYDGIKDNKYINTKGTKIFEKGKTLYNYHIARENIRSKNEVIVMEGFMAVIRSSVNGIKNAVGLMGTAMTKEQANLIAQLSKNVILCFDGDEPGRIASLENGSVLESKGCNVKVVELDNNLDPDDYILKNGADSFKELIKNAITLSDYRIKRLKRNINLKDDKEKTEYINNVLKETSKIEDEIHREFILKKLAKEFEISYNTLEKRLLSLMKEKDKKIEENSNVEVSIKPKEIVKDKYFLASAALLYYMFSNKECLEEYDKGNINFLHEEERFLASEISYYKHRYNTLNIADFYTYIDNKPELREVLDKVLDLDYPDEVSLKDINEYVKVLREYQVNKEIDKLKKELSNEINVNKQVQIMNRIKDLKNNF